MFIWHTFVVEKKNVIDTETGIIDTGKSSIHTEKSAIDTERGAIKAGQGVDADVEDVVNNSVYS